tara:strand:+ start:328 stop:501 length:174 start_codon:yes stop_codon:yes gene_type:complete
MRQAELRHQSDNLNREAGYTVNYPEPQKNQNKAGNQQFGSNENTGRGCVDPDGTEQF